MIPRAGLFLFRFILPLVHFAPSPLAPATLSLSLCYT
jgi:hypothetical protein